MQDITDRAFWQLLHRYGGADVYFTEYFRVYPGSHLIRYIVESITRNPTGRPVVAQMIGNDIPALVRTARELLQYPVAAIDLNLGCPAPVVYRKCAGGGLLREPDRVDSILGALRDAIPARFTVKTRVGFEDEKNFDRFVKIFAKHSLDLLTVHGRTVKQMYRGGVRYDLIAQAAAEVGCPVLANGNIHGPVQAAEVMQQTRVRGLMIGRGAVRNPWLFDQIRQHLRGRTPILPTGRQVLRYIHELHETVCSPTSSDAAQVQRLKKFLNFLGAGVDAEGRFLHRIQRVQATAEFFGVCEEFLDHDRLMPLEPLGPSAEGEASEHGESPVVSAAQA